MLCAELLYERIELLLAEVWALITNAPQLFEYARIPDASPLRLGRTASGVECFQFASALCESALPVERACDV